MFWNSPVLMLGSAYQANGYAGQFIEIIPALDMVVVRTANSSRLHMFFSELGGKITDFFS